MAVSDETYDDANAPQTCTSAPYLGGTGTKEANGLCVHRLVPRIPRAPRVHGKLATRAKCVRATLCKLDSKHLGVPADELDTRGTSRVNLGPQLRLLGQHVPRDLCARRGCHSGNLKHLRGGEE